MQTNHSHGPWRVVGGTEVRGADGTIVCNTADYRVPRPELESVALPDAALIAAAPDLLVALQAVLPNVPGFMDEDYAGRPWLTQARAAIAKATGN